MPHSSASAASFSGFEMAYPEEEPFSPASPKDPRHFAPVVAVRGRAAATARARLRATIRWASAPHAPTCARSPNGSMRQGPM